jgi:hypothetical protein
MFIKNLVLGLIAGIMAGLASIVYSSVYNSSLGTDFSSVAKPSGMIISCLVGCLLAAIGHYVMTRWLKHTGEIIFNLVFALLTFASIMGPFGIKLPLTIEMPELFPGYTVPMHFFPALAWFTLRPFFFKTERQ